MSLTAATATRQTTSTSTTERTSDNDQNPTAEIHLPADIDWEMLDKSKFFFLGAALFSGVSAALYPTVVLKTRLQVCHPPPTCLSAVASILRHEGPRGFYRGFATSLTGTIPARALYMAALEVTKSAVGAFAIKLGVSDPAAAAAANAAAGLSAAVAAQVVWTPIDVVSQRLMVRDSKYNGGIDAVRKIIRSDGVRGLYRGFGMSILTYAPSNAVWWASYSVSQRLIWSGIGYYYCRFGNSKTNGENSFKPSYCTVAAVQGASAAMAGGAAAVVTMPLDTVKTRMQVIEKGMGIGKTVRVLLKEGGWAACYRGLGPRWVSMSLSATTMITTYEFLKRLSAKNQDAI